MKKMMSFLFYMLFVSFAEGQVFCEDCMWLMPELDGVSYDQGYENCLKFHEQMIVKNKVKIKKTLNITTDSIFKESIYDTDGNYTGETEIIKIPKDSIVSDTSMSWQVFYDKRGNPTKEINTYMGGHEECVYKYDGKDRIIEWSTRNYKVIESKDKGNDYYYFPNKMIALYDEDKNSVKKTYFLPDNKPDYTLISNYNKKGDVFEEFKIEKKRQQLYSKKTFYPDGTCDSIYSIDDNGEIQCKIKLLYDDKKNIIEVRYFDEDGIRVHSIVNTFDTIGRIKNKTYWFQSRIFNITDFHYTDSVYIKTVQYFDQNKELTHTEKFIFDYENKLLFFSREVGSDNKEVQFQEEFYYNNDGLIIKAIELESIEDLFIDHRISETIYKYEFYE